jgi:hypothetical protein
MDFWADGLKSTGAEDDYNSVVRFIRIMFFLDVVCFFNGRHA